VHATSIMSGIRTYTRTYTHLLQVGTLQVRDDNVRQRRPVCVAVTESQERTCEVRVATRRAREATLMKLMQGPHGAKQAALPTELLAQVQERVGDEGVATDSATALESRLRRLSHTHSASWHQLGEHSSVDGPERTSNSPHLSLGLPDVGCRRRGGSCPSLLLRQQRGPHNGADGDATVLHVWGQHGRNKTAGAGPLTHTHTHLGFQLLAGPPDLRRCSHTKHCHTRTHTKSTLPVTDTDGTGGRWNSGLRSSKDRSASLLSESSPSASL
jgi:hypothetical protein